MTIEIADRLVKLRKKYGYSQEELADKLGLSRQAVSKWERAEASPDTDNLICLAKLYGVSLDELLATDEDVDTIVKEQVKQDKDNKDKEQEQKKDHVVINEKGIFVNDEDGSSVTIDKNGITCVDSDGTVKTHRKKNKSSVVLSAVEGFLFLAASVTYILLGCLLHWWDTAWVVFFIPEIICSFARCFTNKNAKNFNMPFFACFVFFFVCLFLPRSTNILDVELWHPMWAVFLLIPLYYSLVEVFHKINNKDMTVHELKDHGEIDIESKKEEDED